MHQIKWLNWKRELFHVLFPKVDTNSNCSRIANKISSLHVLFLIQYLFSSIPLFKSSNVAIYSHLISWCNGDIPPSLMVLFLIQYFLSDTTPLKFCNPFKFCLWLWCSSWRYKISAQRKYKNDKYANVSRTWNLRGLQSSDPKFWCFLPPYFMFSLFPNCQMIKEMLMYHYMQMRTSIFRVLHFC